MENLLDSKLQNKEIKEAITESIKSLFPIESATKRLVLDNIYIQDDLDDLDFPQQKEVKLNRKSWQYPIYAKLVIEDTITGRVLAKTERIKIGNIPKITNRFTAILDGNEYQTTNQLRRKSGIYSRIKKNGELEAEFNLAKGLNFKMELDPISQNFVIIFANRQYRLWTLLNLLGIGDTEIKKYWGNELLEINKRGALNTEVSEMTSIYRKLFRKEPKTYNEVIKGLREYFTTGTSIDPEVTKLTLGQEFQHLNAEALLATSKKLLNINKGEDQPDDRDSLIFKRLLSVNDLLGNYFEKQTAVIKRKLQRSLGLKDKINEIISTATFGEPIKRFFTTGDLTSAPPQTNPVAMVDAWRKTTPMGTGGIGTSHAITLETRDVQPTHLGFLDVLATPESGRVGTTVSLTSETKKLKDDMVTPVVNKSNELKWLNPLQFYSSKVGFPDEYRVGTDKKSIITKPETMVMDHGEVKKVSSKEVDYYVRSPKSMFSFPQNLIPFMANTQGNRASTGARMMSQAVSLTDKEAPLVRTRRDNTSTYEDLLGSFLNTEAGVDGVVANIDKNYIYIKPDKSKEIKKIGLYDNFPLNQDGFLDSKVLVNIGDRVKPDTTLSENNYSTGKVLSLGKNMTTAFLSYKGYNFEDGIVMSQSAAKKLSHDMIHKLNVFFSPKLAVFDIQKFKAWYPDLLSLENTEKLDDRGVIKVGATISPGEAVAAFLVEQELDDIEKALKKLDKYTFGNYKKHVTIWEEEDPGVVTEVRRSGRNIDIYIKAKHPLKEGDKVTNRFGGKGIITKLVPDDEMPQRAKGLSPIDIILSPEGVPGRMNIGQILETAAGKIAEKTKKPFIVNNFDDLNVDTAKDIYDQMKKLNIDPNETLTDGVTGQKIKTPIFVGNQYIMKLRHIVIKKEGIHNTGIYDIDQQPTGKGAQKTGTMETYAYLGHGAISNLSEMTSIKGRQNDDYWRDLQFGLPPSRPNRNFVWDKFTTYLKGMGINTEKEGNRIRILPLTDDDTEKLSSGEILDPGAMLVGKNLAMRKDGLFDATITGGPKGTKWSHLNLVTRIPNPMFEDAIMKSLDLTQQGYLDILSGKKELNGKSGMSGIIDNLKKIDVSSTIKKLKDELRVTAPTNVNKLNTKIKYLSALKDFGYTPIEAYTISKLPIIPPVFRPIYPLPSGDLMVADVNKHYRDVGLMNQGIKNVYKDLLPEDIISNEFHLYNSVKALQGLIEPATYSKEKYKGFLADVAKTKTGFIFDSLWAKRQDISARSTVTVEPSLGLDEVGLPFTMAYKMFKPFILKDMKESGIKISNALKFYDAKDSLATTSLQNILRQRPVILNRAPSLHKHSVQAFKPVLMDGKSIKVNPLIMSGYNLDIDGDQQINQIVIFILDKDLKKVYIELNNNIYNKTFWRLRKMSSRLNTKLPYIKGGNYYLVDLEDFPHDENNILGQKEHITFYGVPEEIKVISYDELSGKPILATVAGWSIHKDREVWTITLHDKKQIIADDDPRAVYGLNEDLEFVRNTPENSIGMFVPVLKNIKSEVTIDKLSGFGKLKSEIQLNKQVGYVIGAIIGDGWYDIIRNKYKGVNLAGVEKEVVEQYKKYITKFFFEEPPHFGHRISLHSYGKSEKTILSSVAFAEFIAPLVGKGAKNKHLPPFWFGAPRDFKIGLLSGLLDTDGCVSISYGKEKPQLMINISSISLRLLQEIQHMLYTLEIGSRISFSKVTQADNDFWSLGISSVDIYKIRKELNIVHVSNKKAFTTDNPPNKKSSGYLRTDIIPYSKKFYETYVKGKVPTSSKNYFTYTNSSGQLSRRSAKHLIQEVPNLPDQFVKLIENTQISWKKVVSCENTHKTETGYDLTVPGYETFMSVDGIILSNTMSVMTPISTAAINEANEMMPSKILFKHGDNALVPGLSKDYIFGLYTLSQLGKKTAQKFTSLDEAKKSGVSWNDIIKINNKETTIGQTMINKALPENYRDHTRLMNEQTVSGILTKIGKEKPKVFAEVINSWKDLGAAYSYLHGHTVSLTDFIIDRSYRDDLLKSRLPEIEKIKDQDKKIQAFNDLTKEVEKKQNEYLKTKPNYLKDMLDSGSFKRTDSIRQILSMPGLVTNIKGEPIPIPITKSYGEGLDSTSYWNTLYGVRKGTVDRSVNTQDSGALNKALLSVTRRLLVIMADCGTKRGLEFGTDDKNVMDRFALETVSGIVKRDNIIDGDVILKAKAKNIYKIKVRSPLTCDAVEGVCQLCYGLLPNGEIPPIGTNIGINESSALSEKSTQLVMRSFHTAGSTLAAGGLLESFPRVEQLLKVPANLAGKATLAETEGTIKSIEKNPIGGYSIKTENKSYTIPAGKKPLVTIGAKVYKGDALSQGPIKPQELGELKTHLDAQQYIVDQLDSIYGNKFYKKSFETVVRGISDNAEITNAPEDSGFLRGDNTTISYIESLNKQRKKQGLEKIEFKPYFKSIDTLNLDTPDWLTQVSTNRVKSGLTIGAAKGAYANLKGKDPIPAYIYADDFGKNTDAEKGEFF